MCAPFFFCNTGKCTSSRRTAQVTDLHPRRAALRLHHAEELFGAHQAVLPNVGKEGHLTQVSACPLFFWGWVTGPFETQTRPHHLMARLVDTNLHFSHLVILKLDVPGNPDKRTASNELEACSTAMEPCLAECRPGQSKLKASPCSCPSHTHPVCK